VSINSEEVQFAKPFFVEADRAFRQGTFYPAMLAAAVGFEHALREGQQLAVWEYYDSCLTNFIAYIKSGADTQIRPWLVSIAKTHIGLSENTNYAFSGLFYQLLQFPTFSRFLGEDVAHSGVRDSRPARNLAKFSRLLNKFEYPASDWSVLCSGPSWIGTFSVHCSMEGLFNGCFALL